MNTLVMEPVHVKTPETFDVVKAAEAQGQLCMQTGVPHFAPYKGVCYGCRKIIYERIDHGTYHTGISVDGAAKGHITGCPHCQTSYCN